MIASSLIAMALFGLSQPSTVQTRTLHLRPWAISVRSDRFTGVTTCTARMGRVHIMGGLAIFDLGPSVDTSDAIYRLDLGAAHLARGGDIAERVAYDSERRGSLTNPSGGRVALPLSILTGVRRVDIRAEDPHHVVTFDISALPKVLASEAAAGCQPDAHAPAIPVSAAPAADAAPPMK
jgi:hypothetical protein